MMAEDDPLHIWTIKELGLDRAPEMRPEKLALIREMMARKPDLDAKAWAARVAAWLASFED